MANTQQVLWTLLPNGTKNNGQRLKGSILVTPRLTADGATSATLNAYKDWLDWPAVVKKAKFTMLVDGQPHPVSPDPAVLNSQIWTALFPATTFVRPYQPLDTGKKYGAWLASPTAAIAKNIEQVYAEHALTTTTGIPTKLDHAIAALNSGLIAFNDAQRTAILGRVTSPIASPMSYLNTDAKLSGAMKTPRSRRKASDFLSPLNPAAGKMSVATFSEALDQLKAYHAAVAPATHVSATPMPAAELLQQIDFHQIASGLVQFPALVRAAGLVIDLEFDAAQITAGNHTIEVLVDWPKTTPTKPDLRQPVHVVRNGTSFEATPRNVEGLLTGRWLKLGHPDYSVVKMQADQAGLRYDAYLQGLENEVGTHAAKGAFTDPVYDDTDFVMKPKTSTVPALRSGGMALTLASHADVVASRFAVATQLEAAALNQKDGGANTLPPLDAEHVVRGYRVDVFDTIPNSWFSLCMRDGTYTLTNNPSLSFTTQAEEAMVTVGASTSTDAKGNKVTKLAPHLMAWHGWSLGAPQPGATTNPVRGTPLSTQFVPTKGTLPMLRFGRTYRLRVRVVDLAGNSESFQSTNAVPDYGTEPHLYCRYEPVGSPDLALVKTGSGAEFPADGESMALAAIHTFNQTPDRNTVPTTERARRFIIPPQVDINFAEVEGVFDSGQHLDPAKMQAAANLLAKYKSSKNVLPKVEVGGGGKSQGRGKFLPVAQKPAIYAAFAPGDEIPYLVDPWAVAAVVKVDYVPDSTLAALRALEQSNINLTGKAGTFSAVNSGAFVSAAAAVFGAPGSSYQPNKWGSAGVSPDVNFDILTGAPIPYQPPSSATIVGTNASALTAINAVHPHIAGKIEQPVSPHEIAVAHLAMTSVFAKGPPDELTRLHVVPFYDSADVTHVPQDWPRAKPFTIVAVENGQTEPSFDAASREFRVPLRKGERIFLKISSLIPQEVLSKMSAWWLYSTKREPPPVYAELTAKGRNWLATPWRTVELVHAVQKPLVTPDLGIAFDRKLYAKPATLYFGVNTDGPTTLRLDLFGRWQEPIDDPATNGPTFSDHQQLVLQKTVPRVQPSSDYFYMGGQHPFPDTRYRRVTYKLDAISRFREFMPANIRSDDKNLKVTSNDYRFWIPNAAPPPAPKVLYVVPTFGWTRSAAQSVRYGRGLRVYLERPWFVSGYGEMLAVVLPPQNAATSTVDTTYVTKVTQWGDDPIWMSGRTTTAAPARSDFPAVVLGAPVVYPNVDGVSPQETTDWPRTAFKLSNLPLPPSPKIGMAAVVDSSVSVDIAPHVVGYDAERKLWYADIVLTPARDAYYPFVRLALARYHPLSLPGAHLSSVVLTEFQQLVPDRLAVVSRGGDGATVAIYGTLPQDGRESPKFGAFLAEVQVLPAGGDPDLDWVTVSETTGGLRVDPDASAANLHLALPAQASLHQVQGGKPVAAQLGAIDPQRLGMIPPGEVWNSQQHLLWRATVSLGAAPAGGKRRLLITERETYHTLETSDDYDGQRIVYLETMDV